MYKRVLFALDLEGVNNVVGVPYEGLGKGSYMLMPRKYLKRTGNFTLPHADGIKERFRLREL